MRWVEDFKNNRYIFSSLPAMIEVGEAPRRAREKQISFMIKELFLYKVPLKDLVVHSPNNKDRNLILNIASYIYRDIELFERIQRKRELPIPIVARKTQVSRAFLEIWQDYILAYTIILSNPNYKYIQDYIRVEINEVGTSLIPSGNGKDEVKKGIVLKENKNSLIILSSVGEFVKIKKEEEAKVGEEVQGKEKKGFRHYKLQISLGIVLIILVSFGAYLQYTKVVRTVIIDTTSQIKFELNKFNNVVYIYAPSEKGKAMVEYAQPKNKKLDLAVKKCVEYAKSHEMIPQGGILITISGDALKYGLLQDTAEYIVENEIKVLVNNSGKQHKLSESIAKQKEGNNEDKSKK